MQRSLWTILLTSSVLCSGAWAATEEADLMKGCPADLTVIDLVQRGLRDGMNKKELNSNFNSCVAYRKGYNHGRVIGTGPSTTSGTTSKPTAQCGDGLILNPNWAKSGDPVCITPSNTPTPTWSCADGYTLAFTNTSPRQRICVSAQCSTDTYKNPTQTCPEGYALKTTIDKVVPATCEPLKNATKPITLTCKTGYTLNADKALCTGNAGSAVAPMVACPSGFTQRSQSSFDRRNNSIACINSSTGATQTPTFSCKPGYEKTSASTQNPAFPFMCAQKDSQKPTKSCPTGYNLQSYTDTDKPSVCVLKTAKSMRPTKTCAEGYLLRTFSSNTRVDLCIPKTCAKTKEVTPKLSCPTGYKVNFSLNTIPTCVSNGAKPSTDTCTPDDRIYGGIRTDSLNTHRTKKCSINTDTTTTTTPTPTSTGALDHPYFSHLRFLNGGVARNDDDGDTHGSAGNFSSKGGFSGVGLGGVNPKALDPATASALASARASYSAAQSDFEKAQRDYQNALSDKSMVQNEYSKLNQPGMSADVAAAHTKSMLDAMDTLDSKISKAQAQMNAAQSRMSTARAQTSALGGNGKTATDSQTKDKSFSGGGGSDHDGGKTGGSAGGQSKSKDSSGSSSSSGGKKGF